MSDSPSSTLEPVAADPDVAALEAAWRMPAVEPTRSASRRTRRAAAVQLAVRAGYSPSELVTVVLLGVLVAGIATIVAMQLT